MSTSTFAVQVFRSQTVLDRCIKPVVERLECRQLLSSWQMAGHDIGNTNRADYSIPASRMNDTFFNYFRWQALTPGSPLNGITGSAAMTFFDGIGPAGQDLVVGTYYHDAGIAAMDRHTGQLIWSGMPAGGDRIASITPAFSNDGSTIYVTCSETESPEYPDGHPLMAFSSAGGPSTYRHNGGDADPDKLGENNPRIAPDGRIFLHRAFDRPYAGTDSGTAISLSWSAGTAMPAGCVDPVLYRDGSALRVVSAGAGKLNAYDGTTGAELWSVSHPYPLTGLPTVDPANGNIYVAVSDWFNVSIVGLRADGSALWSSLAKPIFTTSDPYQGQQAGASGALSHDGSTYYYQTTSSYGSGTLYAIDTTSGTVEWSVATSNSSNSSDASPIVTANGVIVVGNNVRTYYAIKDNGSSATVLDTLLVDSSGSARSTPTISADGLMYLPLRTGPSSLHVQNMFTAIDLTADPYELPTVALPLVDPRGISADSTGKVAIAEGNGDTVGIFDSAGKRLLILGQTGSADGQFLEAVDADFDASGNIAALDAGNGRVQWFTQDGQFSGKFGSIGSLPGQLNGPGGLFVDRTTRKVYVADTLNQRVQRFNADGSLDLRWGADGIVGLTGVVRHDHAGFDRPVDVAVNPVTRQVYVADYGNCRIEVFDQSGNYVHTYLGVYHANAIAFDAKANLYIAGEDVEENGYTAADGRLRLLRRGDELISAHYNGGLDDLSRRQVGVAVRADGKILIADGGNQRVAVTDASFAAPASDVSVEAKGQQVTIRWKTPTPTCGAVKYGPTDALESQTQWTSPTTDHVVTLTGLSPNTRLYYAIGFPDTFDGSARFSKTDVINTGVAAGLPFLRLKTVVGLYSDSNTGPGYVPWSAADEAAARQAVKDVGEFFFRNSGFRVYLDQTVVLIDRDVTEPIWSFTALEGDLAALGYSAANDFDLGIVPTLAVDQYLGGGATLFGRLVGMCQAGLDTWPLIHETNHAIDRIFDNIGLVKYEFNHGIWAIPNSIGVEISTNGQIPRNMLPENLTAAAPPYTKVMIAPDADNDGVPDSSPAGLTNQLPFTEATFGSSTSKSDTDGDGLSDLREAMALPFHNTNLAVQDTDGDGLFDGVDPNPAYPIANQILSGTPALDGSISPAEGWTVLSSNWGFSNNNSLVGDTNWNQSETSMYAAWDNDYFYLAMKGPQTWTDIRLDGSADNWFRGPDNYNLRLDNYSDLLGVKINVGVPDIFRQIGDGGGWSEIWDTDPMFYRAYNGNEPMFDPSSGLGFAGRLVTEADLVYRRGGSGSNSVWELAIPWSFKTDFHAHHGQQIAMNIDVGHDLLFETDHAPRFTLIDTIAPAVSSSSFRWQTGPQALNFKFSEDVSAALTPADLILLNQTTGQAVDPSKIAVDFDPLTRIATFTFPGFASGILPDGNYRATLPAAMVCDPAGNALASDADLSFFCLSGDANRDRVVDVTDLGILATNWQGSGKTFAQGDFNYDGAVDVTDLGILATNWQKHVPAVVSPGGSTRVVTVPQPTLAPPIVTPIIRLPLELVANEVNSAMDFGSPNRGPISPPPAPINLKSPHGTPREFSIAEEIFAGPKDLPGSR